MHLVVCTWSALHCYKGTKIQQMMFEAILTGKSNTQNKTQRKRGFFPCSRSHPKEAEEKSGAQWAVHSGCHITMTTLLPEGSTCIHTWWVYTTGHRQTDFTVSQKTLARNEPELPFDRACILLHGPSLRSKLVTAPVDFFFFLKNKTKQKKRFFEKTNIKIHKLAFQPQIT